MMYTYDDALKILNSIKNPKPNLLLISCISNWKTFGERLFNEFDFNLNINDLSITEITRGSKKKVYWVCLDCNNSYLASPMNRISGSGKDKYGNIKGTGCPYCSGQKVMPGFNDFATKCPVEASELLVSKSGFTASEKTFKSHDYAWFRCKYGHDYETQIMNRAEGKGCPYCSGLKTWIGFNDLLTLYPDIANEYDIKKNKRDIRLITWGSDYNAWWICSNCGHSFRQRVVDRTKRGDSCPKCH